MTTSNAIEQTQETTNGVDVGKVMNVIGAIEADPSNANFQWRATNQWIDGSISRSRIKEFFAGNAEDSTRKEAFTIDADAPTIAAGQNSAPNPMEYVLHALAGCLTMTLVALGSRLSNLRTQATWMPAAFSAFQMTCARASARSRSTCASRVRQA